MCLGGPKKSLCTRKGKVNCGLKAGWRKPRKPIPVQKTVQQFVLRKHICFISHLIMDSGIKVTALQTLSRQFGQGSC